jgi:hypothetical protein
MPIEHKATENTSMAVTLSTEPTVEHPNNSHLFTKTYDYYTPHYEANVSGAAGDPASEVRTPAKYYY